jgi:uncharacterized DUF497 family protein
MGMRAVLRTHIAVVTPRQDELRVISLRKANYINDAAAFASFTSSTVWLLSHFAVASSSW